MHSIQAHLFRAGTFSTNGAAILHSTRSFVRRHRFSPVCPRHAAASRCVAFGQSGKVRCQSSILARGPRPVTRRLGWKRFASFFWARINHRDSEKAFPRRHGRSFSERHRRAGAQHYATRAGFVSSPGNDDIVLHTVQAPPPHLIHSSLWAFSEKYTLYRLPEAIHPGRHGMPFEHWYYWQLAQKVIIFVARF